MPKPSHCLTVRAAPIEKEGPDCCHVIECHVFTGRCPMLHSWTVWDGSFVLASASTRRGLRALWCVADATAHRMANCSWRHHDVRRLSRLRRAEHACSCSSPCAAVDNDGLPLWFGTKGYQGKATLVNQTPMTMMMMMMRHSGRSCSAKRKETQNLLSKLEADPGCKNVKVNWFQHGSLCTRTRGLDSTRQLKNCARLAKTNLHHLS